MSAIKRSTNHNPTRGTFHLISRLPLPAIFSSSLLSHTLFTALRLKMEGLIKGILDVALGQDDNKNEESAPQSRDDRSRSTWAQVSLSGFSNTLPIERLVVRFRTRFVMIWDWDCAGGVWGGGWGRSEARVCS